ncbi:hypothetical protein jhhlp_000744 [Lomentospora prolificans]|uniref:Uncharacterized protein n=1 Tax=Lomentospora prolificans TaxID=41688 RepID=A0A2N3NJB1_9PEZI|nr:hypothetical protein jhhlp_000744 [Lomentospora prolificans]
MASTTETVTRTRTARTVLTDYELHHSGASNDASSGPEDSSAARAPTQNPPEWPTTSRRVPPYRPADTERDQSQIRVYTHPIERVFIATMFTGVFVNATVAKQWRRTVGRVNENIFKYPIGGEF